ncbi:GTP-binding protein [Clostridium sp. 'White wine YQ']|uniref:GTP-binding protein n=1 Tax=Clostridium sp. 'White wine YQ' TaxID=3027474 RepID=UPI002366C54B|nr:GTP-binding protein [Clostridium sp. 'White wine YQ']MDD7796141.1 GTP-binding protein [Clostridium sp. 'White wine YQ']
MKFKTDIEIVTGFIGSGKTYFINSLVKNTLLKIEKILIIQCEQGNSKIKEDLVSFKNITILNYDPTEPLDKDILKEIILKHQVHRIIIEYNGTRNLADLLEILNERELKKISNVTSIFFIADCTTYTMFLNNMPTLILPNLYHCNLVVFNNSSKMPKDEFKSIERHILSLNRDTFILSSTSKDSLEKDLNEEDFLDGGMLKLSRILTKTLLSKF